MLSIRTAFRPADSRPVCGKQRATNSVPPFLRLATTNEPDSFPQGVNCVGSAGITEQEAPPRGFVARLPFEKQKSPTPSKIFVLVQAMSTNDKLLKFSHQQPSKRVAIVIIIVRKPAPPYNIRREQKRREHISGNIEHTFVSV